MSIMVRLILDISAARSENCFTLATQMWIYYLAYACIGNSSPRISGAVGDGLAATASVRAPAYATNAGSEHSLTPSASISTDDPVFFSPSYAVLPDDVPIFFKCRLHLAGRPQMSTRR